jgi:signal transduction histidine kinase
MQTLRLGLGTRIALTMVLALLLMQGVNAATFFFLPRPDATIYSARWLISHTSNAAKTIFAVAPADRPDTAKRLGTELKLDIYWRKSAPPDLNGKHPPGYLLRLESSLREAFKDGAKTVSVDARGPGRGARDEERQFIPKGFEDTLPTGPLTSAEPDIPIFGGFEIAIEGTDSSWVRIGPHRPGFLTPLLSPTLITAASAILLISLLSIWTAKRSLRPIDELVAAAQRLGLEREASPIDTRRLGDFTIIGEAINEMQKRIKGFIDERTQMLAAISHDLRTGLTRLRLATEELPDGETKDTLIRNVNDMDQMVSATLVFAGDDLKREHSQGVDIASLLITICDSFADAGAPIEYAGPDHLFTVCQPVAMKRAFMNIIDNAIKYGGSALVELQSAEDALRVSVKDDGPGIPAELVERAFRPFSRLEKSRNRETGGVGLGLAIARDIVSARAPKVAWKLS